MGRTWSGPDPPGAHQAPGRGGRRPAPGHGPMGLRPSSSPNPRSGGRTGPGYRPGPRDRPPTSGDRASLRATSSGPRSPQEATNAQPCSDSATRSPSPPVLSPTTVSIPAQAPVRSRGAGSPSEASRCSRRVSSSRSAPGARRSRATASAVTSRNTRSSCARARHESDTAGGYGAVSGSGTYRGAYQFSQSTWNNTARHAGRPDLVGVDPALAAPWDQDFLALDLYQWQGSAPWGHRCTGK